MAEWSANLYTHNYKMVQENYANDDVITTNILKEVLVTLFNL